MDWNAVRCTECKSHLSCRKVSAMKGSAFCQVKKGYKEAVERTGVFTGAWMLFKKMSPLRGRNLGAPKQKDENDA